MPFTAYLKGLNSGGSEDTLYPQTISTSVNMSNGKTLEASLPFSLGIDAAGNYGYKKNGADTVIPFKTYLVGTISQGLTTTSLTHIECGFRPKQVFLIQNYNAAHCMVFQFNDSHIIHRWYANERDRDVASSFVEGTHWTIDDSGFSWKNAAGAYNQYPIIYIALC